MQPHYYRPSKNLSKTTRQAVKVSQECCDNSLSSDNSNVKITKQAHAFKGDPCSYSVEFLDSFNPKLQLKDAESAIKNKFKQYLLNQEDLNM